MITGLAPGMAAAQLPGLPMTGFSSGGTGLTPFYVLGFELGPWQNYLAQELTPDYMLDGTQVPLHISWLDPEVVTILPAFAAGLLEQPKTWTRFEFDIQFMNTWDAPQDQAFQSPGLGFERELLAPGVFHQFDSNSFIGVEAILARQSYGTARLGMTAHNQPLPGFRDFARYEESARDTGYGTGVRLNLSSELTERMTFGAGFQTRIDMEEFAHYRGVYSSPADFDIPARASVGMAFQTHQNSWLNLSVERVLYSEVSAFPSRMLPDRFLSQLGDSTSPNFEWDDLTVFTLGYTWNNGKDTTWSVDVSTRSTPEPTSNTLRQAIEGDLANHAMTLGYSRRTGVFSRFNVNAAYAPADFIFGGNVLGVASDNLGQDLEVEANWTWDF